MTNGEKMQEMFPEGKTRRCRGGVVFESDGWCHDYDSDWWNTEHKEPTAKCKDKITMPYATPYNCGNYIEQTTMSDLAVDCISRAEMLRYQEYLHGKMPNEENYNLWKFIKDLPSVTPQESRWIPVEERLPEDGQSVLFCDIDNDIMIGYHIKGRPNTHFSQDGTYEDMKNVRAWMPLPSACERR